MFRRKKRKKGKRRLSVKIRDGRKTIQVGGKKYRMVAVKKRAKKRGRPKSKTGRRSTARRRLPPRDSKGRFKKRRRRR
ncbi:hypothetical protein ES703_14464 [subsurface metagenome]